MSMILTAGEAPSAPPEVAEAVELYAREGGRTGSVRYVPYPVNAWEARFSLKPNDPAMRAWQEGRAAEPPMETVLFVEPNPDNGKRKSFVSNGRRIAYVDGPFRAIDIRQLGPSGVRNFLQKGNTWSGRGEFASQEAAVDAAKASNDAMLEKNYATGLDGARYRAHHNRIQYARKPHEKSPMTVVGIDLKEKP